MGMKLGKWRSRTNLTFMDTNLHHPFIILKTIGDLSKNKFALNSGHAIRDAV